MGLRLMDLRRVTKWAAPLYQILYQIHTGAPNSSGQKWMPTNCVGLLIQLHRYYIRDSKLMRYQIAVL